MFTPKVKNVPAVSRPEYIPVIHFNPESRERARQRRLQAAANANISQISPISFASGELRETFASGEDATPGLPGSVSWRTHESEEVATTLFKDGTSTTKQNVSISEHSGFDLDVRSEVASEGAPPSTKSSDYEGYARQKAVNDAFYKTPVKALQPIGEDEEVSNFFEATFIEEHRVPRGKYRTPTKMFWNPNAEGESSPISKMENVQDKEEEFKQPKAACSYKPISPSPSPVRESVRDFEISTVLSPSTVSSREGADSIDYEATPMAAVDSPPAAYQYPCNRLPERPAMVSTSVQNSPTKMCDKSIQNDSVHYSDPSLASPSKADLSMSTLNDSCVPLVPLTNAVTPSRLSIFSKSWGNSLHVPMSKGTLEHMFPINEASENIFNILDKQVCQFPIVVEHLAEDLPCAVLSPVGRSAYPESVVSETLGGSTASPTVDDNITDGTTENGGESEQHASEQEEEERNLSVSILREIEKTERVVSNVQKGGGSIYINYHYKDEWITNVSPASKMLSSPASADKSMTSELSVGTEVRRLVSGLDTAQTSMQDGLAAKFESLSAALNMLETDVCQLSTKIDTCALDQSRASIGRQSSVQERLQEHLRSVLDESVNSHARTFHRAVLDDSVNSKAVTVTSESNCPQRQYTL